MRTLSAVLVFGALASAGALTVAAEDAQIVRDKTHTPNSVEQVRYILIKPQSHDPARKYPLFIFLHGQGASPDSTLQYDFALFTRQDCFVVLPQAPDQRGDGFSWYNLADA